MKILGSLPHLLPNPDLCQEYTSSNGFLKICIIENLNLSLFNSSKFDIKSCVTRGKKNLSFLFF